ncbi:M14 metallopeptidase family protein [Flavobacterium sp. NKUCC04_CG]|uniref:M14 family metallopeptidase n=1 Tax=Flavobacterium sp. NKUCC04_CG TaxID=2842121 RepID=UPI002103F4BF|nr:M14 metallopeptidase family protein [Flavobacterium sp. NKUCC04_CG]
MNIDKICAVYKSPWVYGRYVVSEDLEGLYKELSVDFKLETQGISVEGRAIKSVQVGRGSTRVLMWSQMHGNESTTTKAVADLLCFLNSNEAMAQSFKSQFTLLIIPILNPDGAENYTRVNANEVDLNRDSINLSQPESRCLRNVFDQFRPHYAFNLHDQRTIFAAGKTKNPATISFLAPSYNEAREVNACRLEAMQLIVTMNKELQKYLPNSIGRFDDGFNLNCIGDYFQSRGVPTILFEAGHFPRDYEREVTRSEVFRALLTILTNINSKDFKNIRINDYLAIPENEKSFRDVLFTNVQSIYTDSGKKDRVWVQYKEVLIDKIINFAPTIVAINIEEGLQAHLVVDVPVKWKVSEPDINELIDGNLLELIDLGQLSVNELLKK